MEIDMTRDFNSLQKIADYMIPETDLKPADIAFLFGSRHGLEEFYETTMELLQADMYKYLVISGGVTGDWQESEAGVIKQALIERGHPEDRILVEDRATNTGQNVEFALPIIDDRIGLENVGSIIAIGKMPSARRYLMTLERWWPEPTKMIAPVNYFGVPREKWYENDDFRTRVLADLKKIPGYVEQGFLVELNPKQFPPLPKALFDFSFR